MKRIQWTSTSSYFAVCISRLWYLFLKAPGLFFSKQNYIKFHYGYCEREKDPLLRIYRFFGAKTANPYSFSVANFYVTYFYRFDSFFRSPCNAAAVVILFGIGIDKETIMYREILYIQSLFNVSANFNTLNLLMKKSRRTRIYVYSLQTGFCLM